MHQRPQALDAKAEPPRQLVRLCLQVRRMQPALSWARRQSASERADDGPTGELWLAARVVWKRNRQQNQRMGALRGRAGWMGGCAASNKARAGDRSNPAFNHRSATRLLRPIQNFSTIRI